MDVDDAILWIAKKHAGQKRKHSKIPYFSHCMETMKRVSIYQQKSELNSDEILIAALGHDLIEDTEVTYEDVVDTFGRHIATVIRECSRPKTSISLKDKYSFLKSFQHKSKSALLIKIADRSCNVSDFSNEMETNNYASKYALQAYPLLQAAIKAFPENSIINADLNFLNIIVQMEYSINMFSKDNEIEIKNLLFNEEKL